MKKINKIFLIIVVIVIIILIFPYSNPEKIITQLFLENGNIQIQYKSNDNNADIIVNNKEMFSKILLKGELGLMESYMDEDWDSPDIKKTLFKMLDNEDKLKNAVERKSISLFGMKIKNHIISLFPNNTLTSSKKNIALHYDAGNDLFVKQLGKTMMYTCAYFYKPNMSLDQAQIAKMELIAKKLNLQPGMKIVDIGCGWGSMGYFLATKYNVKVIGVTLSKQQVEFANKNFKHPNLTILYKDYRELNGSFDRVFSIGMFEHVGSKNYKEYFDKCDELLTKNGIMLLHTIGRNEKSGSESRFFKKYIFPEGELPFLSDIISNSYDKWNLEDFQNFGISYSKTLHFWRKNIGNWEKLENYNEHFRRMWDIYLYSCQYFFKKKQNFLWQFVFTKNHNNTPDDLHFIRN